MKKHYLKKEDRIVHKAYLNAQNGDREVDAGFFRKFAELVEEDGSFFGIFAARDLVKSVKEDRRDIVVLGIEAAEEAVEAFKSADAVIHRVDQTALMADIVSELRGLLNAEHAALFVLNGFVDHLDELLCLAEAFQTNDAFYHVESPPKNISNPGRWVRNRCRILPQHYYIIIHQSESIRIRKFCV